MSPSVRRTGLHFPSSYRIKVEFSIFFYEIVYISEIVLVFLRQGVTAVMRKDQ